MRLQSFVAAAALLSASLVAHADTIQENFTAKGNTYSAPGGDYVDSSTFNQFNTSLGTLNSVTINLSGQATPADLVGIFFGVVPSNAHNTQLQGVVTGGLAVQPGPFQFSFAGVVTNSTIFAPFEGSGTDGLSLKFLDPAVDVTASGTLTYNYTPYPAAAAATPEPTSLALLGTGLLGAVGVIRKRFA